MSAARRESISAWLFMLPGLIPLVAFLYWPLGQAFGLSFFQWNLLGDPKFVGTLQYERLIASETFHQSLMVTLVYTVGVSITAYALSLGTAVMLNKAIRGVKAVRTVSLLPAIIPMVVAGVIWKFIYEPTGGPLNQVLAVPFALSQVEMLISPGSRRRLHERRNPCLPSGRTALEGSRAGRCVREGLSTGVFRPEPGM